jgi:hypothetical protein
MSMSDNDENAVNAAHELWQYFNAGKWNEARALLSEEFEVAAITRKDRRAGQFYRPQSRLSRDAHSQASKSPLPF